MVSFLVSKRHNEKAACYRFLFTLVENCNLTAANGGNFQ